MGPIWCYDPTAGRFTQEDPIGLADGMNLYGSAGGDPVNSSDPMGLCPDCLFDIAMLVLDVADWTVIGGAGPLLLTVAVVAAIAPVRSALRADPVRHPIRGRTPGPS